MKNERDNTGKTELLYETDGMLMEFDAVVTGSGKDDKGREYIILDRTAFFPGGGGQPADTGELICENKEHAGIIDVKICNGEVCHFVSTHIREGSAVKGKVDEDIRLSRMQDHGAEHLISGLVHEAFGYDNVGFHMSDSQVVFDLGGPLDIEQIRMIEEKANRIVFRDVPITISFPSREEAQVLEYRSKLDIYENIRLVTIEGVDTCACCAPHLRSTGQFGLIRILDAMPHRGGTRITMIAGLDAYKDYCSLDNNNLKTMELLSAPRNKTCEFTEELSKRYNALKEENALLRREMTGIYTAGALEQLGKNADRSDPALFFSDALDPVGLRDLVNECTKAYGGMVCAFLGDDENGYRYIFAVCPENADKTDIRNVTKEFNNRCSGKGGGSGIMVQGTSTAKRDVIESFFNVWINCNN